MIKVFGIPHCGTVKKARAWLDARGLACQFHDFKKEGVPDERLLAWEALLGWEKLLKKTGTTWRALPMDARADLNRDKALDLLRQQHNLIRRPIVELPDGRILSGFVEAEYQAALGAEA
ncbi:MAG: Spx/MgsR family RNA polymerase-binding regulatory protein [Halothiobacillaceae bacterium]|nr:MAG: Spx/MgsR family RNA polymerase-binding regulatory protein [Halothiobacillaceae bacterium]